ncbi:MAG: hypothetical protein ACRD3S_06095, partial [Terracidiphilus sp.]
IFASESEILQIAPSGAARQWHLDQPPVRLALDGRRLYFTAAKTFSVYDLTTHVVERTVRLRPNFLSLLATDSATTALSINATPGREIAAPTFPPIVVKPDAKGVSFESLSFQGDHPMELRGFSADRKTVLSSPEVVGAEAVRISYLGNLVRVDDLRSKLSVVMDCSTRVKTEIDDVKRTYATIPAPKPTNNPYPMPSFSMPPLKASSETKQLPNRTIDGAAAIGFQSLVKVQGLAGMSVPFFTAGTMAAETWLVNDSIPKAPCDIPQVPRRERGGNARGIVFSLLPPGDPLEPKSVTSIGIGVAGDKSGPQVPQDKFAVIYTVEITGLYSGLPRWSAVERGNRVSLSAADVQRFKPPDGYSNVTSSDPLGPHF